MSGDRSIVLVGLDAAAQFERFGYALGKANGERFVVSSSGLFGKNPEEALKRIAAVINASSVALVAIDAPLGWPEPMGRLLSTHLAGQRLPIQKNAFFRRRTDQMVWAATGKSPLEVGADKIARAAHHAVEVLERLRVLTGQPIPLAWDPPLLGAAAIEVYPAATLRSRAFGRDGYKDKVEGQAVRRRMAKGLKNEVAGLGVLARKSDHEFDAGLCILAAKDFLCGHVVKPTQKKLAEREGWIWVKPKYSPEEIATRLFETTRTDVS